MLDIQLQPTIWRRLRDKIPNEAESHDILASRHATPQLEYRIRCGEVWMTVPFKHTLNFSFLLHSDRRSGNGEADDGKFWVGHWSVKIYPLAGIKDIKTDSASGSSLKIDGMNELLGLEGWLSVACAHDKSCNWHRSGDSNPLWRCPASRTQLINLFI